MTTHKEKLLFIIAIFALTMSFIFKRGVHYPQIKVDKQLSKVSVDPVFLTLLSFGQKRMISSLFWIDVLLDADHEHYKNNDLNSWMYLRFLTISKLDPHFYQNYLFGGLYLSVIKDDDLGAKEIYDRGLVLFPESAELLQNAAFHYRFELHDYVGAERLYERLSVHPKVPLYLKSILARLKSHNNDKEGALEILNEIYLRAPENSKVKERIFESLYALKAEIDLECLNGKNSDKVCPQRDLLNQPYVKDANGHYQSQKKFSPFSLGH